MLDQDLEDVLRRYRPCGPPSSLRARCVAPSRPARWPYVAAAALVLVALGTYRASAALQPQTLRPATDAAAVAHLTTWLGGGVEAEHAARDTVARFRIDEAARVTRVDGPTGSEQERFPR